MKLSTKSMAGGKELVAIERVEFIGRGKAWQQGSTNGELRVDGDFMLLMILILLSFCVVVSSSMGLFICMPIADKDIGICISIETCCLEQEAKLLAGISSSIISLSWNVTNGCKRIHEENTDQSG